MPKKTTNELKEKFEVTFIIQSPKLDFEAISAAMNIAPSYTHRVGDLSLTKKVLPHDMWSLTSPLLEGQEEPFDAQLKWLAGQLKPHYEFIKLIRKNSEVYIRCSLITEKEQSGFSLSPEALKLLTELEISMDVSILAI